MRMLLKIFQLEASTWKRSNIPKILDEWIMYMDDYYTLANYNVVAQGIMGRAKLEGSTKLWWKLHC